jgi:UDP-3-O-[3-hydroxymyristoyl] N-acetylglucosamine deacetylase
MATVIGNDDMQISTIEHFLSALYAYGIDNLRVVLEGDEMPIMDGSAISFCLLFDEVGIKELDMPKKIIKVRKRVEIKDGDKYVALEPGKSSIFDFEITFNHPVIGKQKYIFNFSTQRYLDEISKARTFGFARDIQKLQSMNLALGASLKNAIGLDEHKVLNSEGLRYPDEFVRHKILDAMGDMMVMGHNVLGYYRSSAGSHRLNHLLTKKLLSDEANYEIVTISKLGNRSYAKSFA